MSAEASLNAVPSDTKSKPQIIDDKSPHCIPFILSLLSTHPTGQPPSKPFIIALNGIQGAGKTTLVSALAISLTAKGYNTLVLSIDDLYLKHADQVALAEQNAQNPLVQHRGEPGTHDMKLADYVFGSLRKGKEFRVPEYDKSAYNGQGDRVPESEWKIVNGEDKIQVVIFEGWCVGFSALTDSEVEQKWKTLPNSLGKHRLEDLLFVNDKLREYEVLNEQFDAMIYIDAQETKWVYDWREEQEAVLRREKGTGMSIEQVRVFVDGYYPAYELYTEKLRDGFFKKRGGGKGKQLSLVVGRDRRVIDVAKV